MKSPEQLCAAAGPPNFGFVALDPQVPKRPPTVHEDPHSPRVEAFRQLRTNLHFVEVDTPPRVIALTSAVAGEGKTTMFANLAIALGLAERRVLVVEADLRRPKLADYLGLEGIVALTSVLAGRTQLARPCRRGVAAFDALASRLRPPNPSEVLSSQHMRNVLGPNSGRAMTTSYSTPRPLLPATDAAAIARFTNGAILVCRYGRTTSPQVHRAAEARVLRIVLTMVPTPARGGTRSATRTTALRCRSCRMLWSTGQRVNGSAAPRPVPRPHPSEQ